MAFPPKPGTLILLRLLSTGSLDYGPAPKPIGVIEEYTGNLDYFRV